MKIHASAFLGGLVVANHALLSFALDKPSVLVKANHISSLKESKKPGVSLLHVISPFGVENCLPQFCPFDQAQSVVVGSMLRAKDNTSRGHVTLAATAFEDEQKNVVPEGFDALPALTRSTETEYPELLSSERLPFIQDIIDRALNHNVDSEYIIYTNSDIILHESFYDTVQNTIANEGYDFFTINRRTVSKSRDDGELRTKADLDEIFVSEYEQHPGNDCFIMKREIAEKLNLGDIFIGTIFFANTMSLQAYYHSSNPASFKSEEVIGTFHLGDDRKWSDMRKLASIKQNAMNSICQNQFLQDVCSAEDLAEKRPNVWIHCKRLKKKMQKWVERDFEFNDNNNICHSSLKKNHPETTKARFVFSLGTEGTGHHFLSKLEKSSNFAKLAKTEQWFGILREEQRQSAKLLRGIYRLDDLPTSPDTLDLTPAYEELVKKLKKMQGIVNENIDPSRVGNNEVLSIHLNAFMNFMTSFPATNTTARYTQLPDLGIFYKACQDAEVECGHILMTRDAHEILRSTTKNRFHDHPKRQIINLSMHLNMMISQAIQYSEKLVGCFHFNDPTSLLRQWTGGDMFGWNIDDNSLENAIKMYYSPSRSMTEEERVELVPDGFDLYMESMMRATEMLRTTCQTQLLGGQSEIPAVPLEHPANDGLSHLLPPYKIVQIGAPRTGSTFQFELLRAIVALKSPAGAEIKSRVVSKSDWNEGVFEELQSSTESFVVKTHIADERLIAASDSGSVSVFSSSDIVPYSLYTQQRQNIEDCSACEIDQYRSLFDLTDEDVATLKKHMQDYEILRQCCGFQMSKYEVLRLNGCDVSEYTEQPDYPHCERHDLSSVEMSFANSPISFETTNPEFNWAAPGDCARLNAEVATGKGFNGRRLDGCKLNGKFAGVKGSEGTATKTVAAPEEHAPRIGSPEHNQAEISPMLKNSIESERVLKRCPRGHVWSGRAGECVPRVRPHNCPNGQRWNRLMRRCVPQDSENTVHPSCPDGQVWDDEAHECVDIGSNIIYNCPDGQMWDDTVQECVPDDEDT
mmetsp:Transcript_4109/g.5555  ORF Transcript_4109/g.5555 Transcript_4109/m.5555 type:complete len:1031 (-) Transcript_4109:239-3331(-)